MSSEVLQYSPGPGATAVGSQGRIWNLLSAPGGPVTITCDVRSQKGGQTQPRVFKNVPAGTKFTAAHGESWTYLRIDSAVAQTITIFIGDEDLQFNNAVTITGLAAVAIQPSSTINSPVATALAGNTTDPTGVPTNLARRRVTVYNLAASLGSIRVSDTGITGRGIEIAAGTYAEFDTTDSLGIRCDTANGATWGYFEES